MSKLRSSTFFWAAFDPPGDHPAFDGLAFLHAQPGEHAFDPVAGELAHQVVFERQEEAAGAGIALAAGAAAKLVVDAPASCRSVPMMCRPPSAATSRPFVVHLLALGDFARPVASQSSCGTSSRVGVFVLAGCAQAMNSGLPPRMMSVPRPAMLVAIVTAPLRPAWATISASRS